MTVKTPSSKSPKAAAAASTKTASKSTASSKAVPVTDAELLKMAEKDYMNKAQLAFFRLKLVTLKDDLLKNASETTEHLRENILVPDPADRATIEEEHALELRTRAQKSRASISPY
jgi:DnaK suppressor protein